MLYLASRLYPKKVEEEVVKVIKDIVYANKLTKEQETWINYLQNHGRKRRKMKLLEKRSFKSRKTKENMGRVEIIKDVEKSRSGIRNNHKGRNSNQEKISTENQF